MATNEARLEARARRAYELGRLRSAMRLVPFLLAAAMAAIACGRPFSVVCAISAAALGLAVGISFRGGSAGRAVLPGLIAGAAPLLFPLLMSTVGHACFGPLCYALGRPACVLGGAVAGVVVATAAKRHHRDPAFIAAALALAGLTGSLGCTVAGVAGIVGMIAGTIAAGAPVLVAARR